MRTTCFRTSPAVQFNNPSPSSRSLSRGRFHADLAARASSRETCSILTTSPNAVTSPVHDRMPVILEPDGYGLWLDPGMRDEGAASDLRRPCDARLMRCYPVSSRVNHVANDDEGCSAPVGLNQAQDRPNYNYQNKHHLLVSFQTRVWRVKTALDFADAGSIVGAFCQSPVARLWAWPHWLSGSPTPLSERTE
jgi:hypothetical protein